MKYQNSDTKKLFFSAKIRSLLIYNFSSLFMAGYLSKKEIDNYEIYLKRKYIGLPWDIKSITISNIFQWYRKSVG